MNNFAYNLKILYSNWIVSLIVNLIFVNLQINLKSHYSMVNGIANFVAASSNEYVTGVKELEMT